MRKAIEGLAWWAAIVVVFAGVGFVFFVAPGCSHNHHQPYAPNVDLTCTACTKVCKDAEIWKGTPVGDELARKCDLCEKWEWKFKCND